MIENEPEVTPWVAYAGHREIVTRLISSRTAGEEKGDAAQKGNNELRPNGVRHGS